VDRPADVGPMEDAHAVFEAPLAVGLND